MAAIEPRRTPATCSGALWLLLDLRVLTAYSGIQQHMAAIESCTVILPFVARVPVYDLWELHWISLCKCVMSTDKFCMQWDSVVSVATSLSTGAVEVSGSWWLISDYLICWVGLQLHGRRWARPVLGWEGTFSNQHVLVIGWAKQRVLSALGPQCRNWVIGCHNDCGSDNGPRTLRERGNLSRMP